MAKDKIKIKNMKEQSAIRYTSLDQLKESEELSIKMEVFMKAKYIQVQKMASEDIFIQMVHIMLVNFRQMIIIRVFYTTKMVNSTNMLNMKNKKKMNIITEYNY